MFGNDNVDKIAQKASAINIDQLVTALFKARMHVPTGSDTIGGKNKSPPNGANKRGLIRNIFVFSYSLCKMSGSKT